MAYNLNLRPVAETDLEEAIEYYEQQSKELGIDFYLEFIAFCDLIENFPERFPPKFPPCQRVLMKKFPYEIYFYVDESRQNIEILTIWNRKRNPENLKKRLKF